MAFADFFHLPARPARLFAPAALSAAVLFGGTHALAQDSAYLIDLAQSDLPADAQWYVHANVDGLRRSELLAPLYDESLGEAFEDIADDTGLDLSEELMAVTAFGSNDQPDSATVVLHGLSEAAQVAIMDVLVEHVEVLEMDYAGVSYFQLSGDGEKKSRVNLDRPFMLSFGPDQTLITGDLTSLQQFIDAGSRMAGGDGPAAAGALLVMRANQSLMQGGMNPGRMSRGPFDSSMMENIDQLGGVISESAAGLNIFAKVYTRDDATASYVHNIVQGLLSLKALDSGSDPNINTLINSLSITSDGPEVTLDLTIPPELAADLADGI
ncbi:MAG: hypothetical protein AB8B96_17945 [Lysobacterales bacterium]